MKIVICKTCGKEFRGYTKNPICCCQKCMTEYKNTTEYKERLSNIKKNYSDEKKKAIRNKIEKTSLERYGVKCNMASENEDINGRGTIRKKYGGLGGASTIISEKCRKTKLERYGNPNYTNMEQTRLTWRNKSEEEKNKILETRKKTMVDRHGAAFYPLTEEFKDLYNDKNWNSIRMQKIIASKTKRGTTNSSKNEEDACNKLQNFFNVIVSEYRSEKYPFFCDFYIPELDLYIEYQEHWTHGKKPFEGTEEDLKKLEIWKEKAKTSKFYQNAIKVWTERDPLKRKTALQNKLNWIEFFNIKDFEKWVNKYEK